MDDLCVVCRRAESDCDHGSCAECGCEDCDFEIEEEQ